MLIQAREKLREIFKTDPVFLFDTEEMFETGQENGLNSVLVKAENQKNISDQISADIVFVVSDRELRTIPSFSDILKSRNVLQIATHAFDGGTEATRYTLEMCRTLDLRDCVRRNTEVIAEFMTSRDRFMFTGSKSDVKFTLSQNIRLMETATKSHILEQGMDYALSTYTEVALIPNRIKAKDISPKELGYDVSGSFLCDGTLVAVHHGTHQSAQDRHKLIALIMERLYDDDEFPLHIEVDRSKVVSVVTKSGRQILPELLRHMDPILYDNIVELAVGTNAGATPEHLIWRYNSPINESALGFHIAVGDGAMSPHIDFICSSAEAYESFFQR